MKNDAMTATAALERRRGERTHQHRALLLFAMCHPDRRALRSIARACARNEATVRHWRKRWEWMARVDHPMAEEAAVHAYRMLYLRDHGATELPELTDRIVVSMSANPAHDPPPAAVIDDIRTAERIAKDEVLRRRGERDVVRASHVSLVDGALGYVMAEMEEGKIRASLKDIPALLKARAVLTGEAVDGEAGGALAVETVRVKQARSHGGSVLTAMRTDLAEFDVILGALEAREEMERAAEVDAVPAAVGDDSGGAGLTLVE